MINISKAQLAADIDAGMKREQIIEKYSTDKVKLTNGDVTKILKATGLKIRKFKKPTFKIVDDTANFLAVDTATAIEIKEEAEKGAINGSYGPVLVVEEEKSAGENTQEGVDNNNN